jgi:heptosyltransferase-2
MGYNTDGRSLMLTHGVKVTKAVKEEHQVHYYLEMLKSLGMCIPDDPSPRLYIDDTSAAEADRLLSGAGIGPDDIVIGINPGAQYGVAKKWFPERYADVSDMLVWKYGVKVVIFGAPGDVDAACAVEAAMDEPNLNLAGRTNLKQLMALIKRCRVFITNDTGSMHVSAALGTPTLAVFGSTDHIATGPSGSGNVVVRDPVQCSPCLKRTCPLKHYRCLDNVTVEMVYQAATRMLEDA